MKETKGEAESADGLSFNMEQLVKNTRDKLKKFISRRVYNPNDVEDILQMTYLEVFRNHHKFSGASSRETWVFGIASNLIRNHFKKLFGKPEMVVLDEVMFLKSEDIFNPDYVNEYKMQLYRTLEVMAAMPEKMQDVVYFMMDTDSNYHDAAKNLGIPVGTIRSRLSRARKILKAHI